MASGGRAAFFSGSVFTVDVVVVVVFWGGCCAAAGKRPNIRANPDRLHFTQFFTRAKSSLEILTDDQFVEA
jgi:hypothetical protein